MNSVSLSWTKGFNAAYRLTLRALSASVRHHPTATKNLRRLYRPTFREATLKFRQNAEAPSEETRNWLQEWDSRLDRTLALLLSSSTNSGTLNRFVRNISMLTDAFHTRVAADILAHGRLAVKWNGQDMSKNIDQVARKRKSTTPSPKDMVQLSAWSALGELALAAETDARILVGRQEQRRFPFVRLSVQRRRGGPHKKNQRHVYNFIGRVSARPQGLKF